MARPTEIFPDFPYSWTETISGVEPDAGTRSLHVWLSQPGRHTSRLTVNQATWEVTLSPADLSRMEPGPANLIIVLKESGENAEKQEEVSIPIRGDTRSIEDEHAYKMLRAIEAAMENESRPPWEEDIAVDGETYRFASLADMQTARDKWRRELKTIRDRYRASAGLPSKNRILSKF